MTVAIAAGTIRIASGAQVAVASGNGTIGTADGSNPRIDLVSASDTGTKTVTAGTAAANPKAPALPAGHIGLALVYIPASDTTIATDQITDKRVMLPTWATAGESFLTSPVTISLADTFYDGPSQSLAAGTYLIWGSVLSITAQATHIEAKLWDGSNVFHTTEQYFLTTGATVELNTFAYVVLSTTTTVKVSVAHDNNTSGTHSILDSAQVNGDADKASKIMWLRIA